MSKNSKRAILIVLGIVLITVLGTTFAYFYAVANNSGDPITGNTFDFGASISLNTIYRANNLVPLSNDKVIRAITKQQNKCIDINNRDVCSMYQIILSNTGDDVVVSPFVSATNSTYTTTNMRCQLYDTSYNAVSDVITLSNVVDEKVYLTSSGNNITITLGSSSQTYYLVVWLTETLNSQTSDYNKVYNGKITFAAGEAGEVYTDFTS